MLKRICTISLAIVLSLSLGGCLFKEFHPTIQQGNILDKRSVTAVKRGMSMGQVRKILGPPVLSNVYKSNQTAYVYTLQVKGGKIHKRYVVIYFQGGRVVRKEVRIDWPDLPKP